MSFKITFVSGMSGESQVLSQSRASGESLLDIALAAGVEIDHACGGVCACSTCHVKIKHGATSLSESSEQEEDQLFWETFDSLKTFITESTNCTVLRHDNLEADDLVAGWIQSHPADQHVIVSSDSDFHQLLAENVVQYNGITDELHTTKGIFDKKGAPVKDKKTKEAKTIPAPEWILFEKCIRGDPTDNVFSAYPGVRTKGTKNKVGLTEAFADRANRGFSWNNLMLQRWTDHNGVEHRVLDDYERNRTLIDLSAQPDHVKTWIAETIATNSVVKRVPQIGTHLLKLCGKFDLKRVSENASGCVAFLSAEYPEVK